MTASFASGRLYTPPVVPGGVNLSMSHLTLSSHASPPHALLASRKGKAGAAGGGDDDGADDGEGGGGGGRGEAKGSDDLDLMYDPTLNCYYDPKTNKYYELA